MSSATFSTMPRTMPDPAQQMTLLFKYNQWANRRTLGACEALTSEQFTRAMGSSFSSVRDTLAHIYGAEWVWLERFHGRSPMALPTGTDFPDWAAVRSRLEEMDNALLEYVAGLRAGDLDRVIEFSTFAGKASSGPLWSMLQHLANHGTYHRGQITTMLRQLGTKPAGTDLIGFYRELAASAPA
ncbi:MAG: DinB family protein [Candidatus Acidiferrales bacterium]